MTINDVVKLTGLSKRTLHHYDEIGLLVPKRQDDNGYRIYDQEDLLRLEQILLYKELGFELKDIGHLVDDGGENVYDVMRMHRATLVAKRDRLNRIITLVEQRMEGEYDMAFDAFDMTDIERAKEQYDEEARKKWGDTQAYQQSRSKTAQYTKQDWAKITAEADEIFAGFNHLRDKPADDAGRLALAELWREHITRYYYDCTYEILSGLGEMYVADERFTQNIDKHGQGTARAMSDTIKVLCEQKINNG